MTRIQIRRVLTGLAALALTANAALGQEPAQPTDWCTHVAVPDTTGWRQFQSGPFEFKASSRMTETPIEGIDSYLARWDSPDSTIIEADVGVHTGHFLPRAGTPSPRRIVGVCRDGFNGQWPQIVLFVDSDRRYGAGLWWPRPGGRIVGQPGGYVTVDAIHFVAHSPDSAAVGELLAVVRSVRWRSTER